MKGKSKGWSGGAQGHTQLPVPVLVLAAATEGPGAQYGPVIWGYTKHQPGPQQCSTIAANKGLKASWVTGEARQDTKRTWVRWARCAGDIGQQATQSWASHQCPTGVWSLGEAREQQQCWPLAAPGLLSGGRTVAWPWCAQCTRHPKQGCTPGGASWLDWVRWWKRGTALWRPVWGDVSWACGIALRYQP